MRQPQPLTVVVVVVHSNTSKKLVYMSLKSNLKAAPPKSLKRLK